MKKDIHPKNYRLVVFKDMSNDVTFLSRSTINTKETIKWEDGNEYPLVKLEISSAVLISSTISTRSSSRRRKTSKLDATSKREALAIARAFFLPWHYYCRIFAPHI